MIVITLSSIRVGVKYLVRHLADGVVGRVPRDPRLSPFVVESFASWIRSTLTMPILTSSD
jgi:hypothetical protein